MNIEKLPSGSWRIRKTIKGKTYSVIMDYKPTKTEAENIMFEKIMESKNEAEKKNTITFKEAGAKYIESKESVLSPKTVREYKSMNKNIAEWFSGKPVMDIEQLDINTLVNKLSADKKSPKTIRNYHGFVSAVLKTFRPTISINTTLPQKVRNAVYIPSKDDIDKILNELRETEFETPIRLAMHGMRRSEICSLTVDDIQKVIYQDKKTGYQITINKATVLNEDNEWVQKGTKVSASTRTIPIDTELAEMILEKGYVYKGHPNSITCKMKKVQKKLEIEPFGIHKLRHYFASELVANGIPAVDIQYLGGWETDIVMKTVYTHSKLEQDKESRRKAMDIISRK